MARPIVNHADRGAFVYDPFVGSGTTILACEESGRSCLAIELNPDYCAMSIARWEAASRQSAIREA